MPKPKPKQKVVTSTSSSKSQSQKPQTQQPTQSSPNWPPFPQRVHYNHAPFPSLTPLIPAQVLVAERFWDAALCRTYLSFLRTLDLTTTPGRPKKGEALRVNDRFQVADEAFAWRLWKEGGVQKLVANAVAGEDGANFEDEAGYGNGYAEDGVAGVAPMRDEVAARRQEELKSKEGELWGGDIVGLNPNIRVYRYSKGQFFDCHYDDSNLVTLTPPESSQPVACKTTWTLLLYLTSSSTAAGSDCVGGETVFYRHDRRSAAEAVSVAPRQGMLLLHKHGEDCLLHEGKEVTDGEKWILRTDLCVRK